MDDAERAPVSNKTGDLRLELNGDGKDPDSGYRAVMKLENGKLLYTLYRNTAVLASKTGPALATTTDYSFRLLHMGKRIWLEQDGEEVLEASDPQPLPASVPAIARTGVSRWRATCWCWGTICWIIPLPRRRWIGSSKAPGWKPRAGPAAPQWSFLAGWSRGDTVLWHKERITGDQSFEAFVGPKMEYPRERDIYDNRYRNFSITICSDGHDPRSGYAGIYGAPDAAGKVPNQRAVLLRNGVEVASTALSVPGRSTSHRHWFEVELRKKGATVEFWVEGKSLLSYTDPNPIDGGVPPSGPRITASPSPSPSSISPSRHSRARKHRCSSTPRGTRSGRMSTRR